jgi:hypothetical protein
MAETKKLIVQHVGLQGEGGEGDQIKHAGRLNEGHWNSAQIWSTRTENIKLCPNRTNDKQQNLERA